MQTTQQLSVTLPDDLVAQVRSKVDSGEYTSESEVVSDGLRALQAREHAQEAWLISEAVPAYEAWKADRTIVRSLDDVRASLAAEHRQAININ